MIDTDQSTTTPPNRKAFETVVDLSGYASWHDLYRELKRLLDENRSFWGDLPITCKLPEFDFAEEQVLNLQQLIERTGCHIAQMQSSNPHNKALLTKSGFTVAEHTPTTAKPKISHQHQLTENTPPPAIAPTSKAATAKPLAVEHRDFNVLTPNSFAADTAYVGAHEHIALRSGQQISYDGNLIIFGDTNPGCQIFATGSIIVYGKLCGNIHAGWNQQDPELLLQVFVKALKMGEPLQISIGMYTACSVESSSNKDTQKRKLYPETARVVDGQIWRFPDFP